jgi:hypothetical protein
MRQAAAQTCLIQTTFWAPSLTALAVTGQWGVLLVRRRESRDEGRSKACGTFDFNRSPERLDAVCDTDQSRSAPRIGATDAVILYLERENPVHNVEINKCASCVGVLRDICERLGSDIVSGDLNRLSEAFLAPGNNLNRTC